MSSVAAGIAVYLLVLWFTRIAGRRTLAQTTVFDIALLLIIAETTQGALLRDDRSFTNLVVLLATLTFLDVMFSYIKLRFPTADGIIDGLPTLLVRDGQPLTGDMQRSRVTIDDVLEAARTQHGLSRFDQIEAAVLETGGAISIIPR